MGGGEVKLIDHVSAYATLANAGVRNEKTAILRIEDAKGNILEHFEGNPGTRVVDEKYISALDNILSTNAYRAPIFGENNPLSFKDRPVVAKTGTTNEWRDGWTMGYTPSLAVGVWVGNNDNRIMKPGSDGSIVAAPLWRAFMDEALKGSPVEDFPKYNPDDFKTLPQYHKDFAGEGIHIAFIYTEYLKKLILKLKYDHRYDIAFFLAERLALSIQTNETIMQQIAKKPTYITHVPTHRRRKRFFR